MHLFILLYSLSSFSFVLIDKNYRLAKPSDTKVLISSEGCRANGITDAELKNALKKAIVLWNGIPEADLHLAFKGNSGTSAMSTTVPSGQVIVGCDSLGAGAAAATNLDTENKSARIRVNSDDFTPGNYRDDALIGVLVHELGHAIGLGHSKDPSSVMTYEDNGWSPMPSYLSQDDVDGVIYLYPNKKEMAGLVGSCESFASQGEPSERANFLIDLVLGAFLVILGRFFYRKLRLNR